MNEHAAGEQPADDERQAPPGLTTSLAGGAVTLTAAPARKVVIRPDEITLTGYASDELAAAVAAIEHHPVLCVGDAGPFMRVHSHVPLDVKPFGLGAMPFGNGAEETGQSRG